VTEIFAGPNAAASLIADQKKCKHCRELIKSDARKCKHCGSHLDHRFFVKISTTFLSLVVAVVSTATLAVQQLSGYDFNFFGKWVAISFEDAEGINAGITTIRLEGVQVGKVKDVTPVGLGRVIVEAKMNRGAERYLLSNTKFYIVRPRIGIQGVTELEIDATGEEESAS
jgi:paraquat-inducible protein B